MSKSTPSTSTTVQSNPLAQAQQPFLQGLWTGGASNAGVLPGSQPLGQDLLNQMIAYGQNQFTNTSGPASGTMPGALNYVQQILSGQYPQANMPAGQQLGALGDIGQNAQAAGTSYGDQLARAAYGVPGAVAPYQQSLSDLATGARSAASNYAGGLAGAAQQAPGTVAPAVAGLNSLAGQYSPLSGIGYGLGGSLQGMGQGAVGAGQGALGALGGLAPAGMNVANPAVSGLYANAGMGIAGNPIFDSLRGMASGQYVDPRTNPALAGTIQAATQPLVNQYQTAIAPQLDSGFEAGGRYGSGAALNARGQAQYGLGQALSGATSNIVNNAYNTGLNSMLGAGQALGSAYNTGVGNVSNALSQAGGLGQAGVGLAGNLLNQGYGALNQAYGTGGQLTGQAGSTIGNLVNTGLSGAGNLLNQGGQLGLSGLQALMSGLGAAGNLSNQGYQTAGNLTNQAGQLGLGGQNALLSGLAAGAGATNQGYGTAANAFGQAGNLANTGALNLGGIAQMSPDLANFPLSQLSAGYNAGWLPLQNFASLLGQPIGGNTSSTTTQQMSQNVGSQILSGITGLGSIAKLFF